MPAPFRRRQLVLGKTSGGWWNNNGAVNGAMVAYRAKGASSLAASYSNLVSPGVHDASLGVAPTFNAATGWTFNGTSQYLITDLQPVAGWSIFVQFANATHAAMDAILGEFNGSTTQSLVELALTTSDSLVYGNGGFIVTPLHSLVAGNMGVAGLQPYLNGVTDGAAIATPVSGAQLPIYIGGRNDVTTGIVLFYTGDIIAVAIYNVVLSPSDVATISASMAAL